MRIKKKKLFLHALSALGIANVAIFLPASFAHADAITEFVQTGAATVARFFVIFLGGMLWMLTGALVLVAQFNTFIGSTAVENGWTIVRDVCNMFFVLILLAIAIGTILQQEKYHYSKLLTKFILAAVLINFSRTICGIIIDISQVVMLTFVGAFSQSTGANFAVLFGSDKLIQTATNPDLSKELGNIVPILLTYFLAVVFLAVADIVITIMLMVLIFRIVMLWFFIVLSPFAFLLSILEDTQKYAQQWWDQFMNYVVVGPAMAFFLWLSLSVVQKYSYNTTSGKPNPAGKTNISAEVTRPVGSAVLGKKEEEIKKLEESGVLFKQAPKIGISQLGSFEAVLSFVLGIGMLMGTLMVSSQLGVAGGKMAGSAVSWMGDVAAGRKGFLQWNTAMSTAFKSFESRQAEPWTKRGERAGGAAGQGISRAMNWALTPLETGLGKISGGRLGLADRARRQEAMEKYREERRRANIDSRSHAYHINSETDLSKLRNLADSTKEKDKFKRAAATERLLELQALTTSQEDQNIVNQHREFLGDVPHMKSEFDKTVKKANPNLAFETIYATKRDENGAITDVNYERMLADLKNGDLSSAALTREMLAIIEHQLERENLSPDELQQLHAIDTVSDDELRAGVHVDGVDDNLLTQEQKDALQIELLKYEKDEERDAAEQEYYAQHRVRQRGKKLDSFTETEGPRAGQRKVESFGNQWLNMMTDDKEIKDKIGSMSEIAKNYMEQDMERLGDQFTNEQRIAFGKASGAWSKAFNIEDEQHKAVLQKEVLLRDIDGFMTSVSHVSLGDENLMEFVLSSPYTKSWQRHGDTFYTDKLKSRAFTGSAGRVLKGYMKKEQDKLTAFQEVFQEEFEQEMQQELASAQADIDQRAAQIMLHAPPTTTFDQAHAQALTERRENRTAPVRERVLTRMKDEGRDFTPEDIGGLHDEIGSGKRIEQRAFNAKMTELGHRNEEERAQAPQEHVEVAQTHAQAERAQAEAKIARINRMQNLAVTADKGLAGLNSEGTQDVFYNWKIAYEKTYNNSKNVLQKSEEESRADARDAAAMILGSVQHQISQNRMDGKHFEDTPKTREMRSIGDMHDDATENDVRDLNALSVLRMTNDDIGRLADVHRKHVGDAIEVLNEKLDEQVFGVIAAQRRAAQDQGQAVNDTKLIEWFKVAVENMRIAGQKVGTYDDLKNRTQRLNALQSVSGLENSQGENVGLPQEFREIEAKIGAYLNTYEDGVRGGLRKGIPQIP